MAFSQNDLDKLKSAMATGVRRVRLDGKETEFRSHDEMMQIMRAIEDELGKNKNRYGVTRLRTPQR